MSGLVETSQKPVDHEADSSHHHEAFHMENLKETTPSEDCDNAIKIFEGDDNFHYTSKEESWVRWKLDLILLPLMFFTYVFAAIDKIALSEASIFGIKEDNHLVGQDYSWASSMFYFGYLVFQYPSSRLMQKLPLGRYFGAMVMMWGLVTTTTAATTSFGTLAVNRFFLGFFESCQNPILTILVSQYWTRKEQPLRACIWWAGGAVGFFLGDSITYGVSGTTFAGSGYATWQIIYFIFGPLTMAYGILLFFAVPTSPMTAWFLTEHERKIQVLRVIKNHTGIENRYYKHYQVLECLRDPQVYMLLALAFLQCIPGGGLTAFDKIVINGMGFSDRETTLLSLGEDGIQFCSVIFAGIVCVNFTNARCIAMIGSNIVVLIGSVLCYALPLSDSSSRLGGFYILLVNTVTFIMCLSLISSNIAGFTKKATASVMFFIAYCVGQIITPQLFLSSQAPTYPTGFRAFFTTVSLMIVIQILLATYYIMVNKRRDSIAPASNSDHVSDADFLDVTDMEQPGFRYIW